MAYQIATFPMTLNDLQSHSPIANLFKCASVNNSSTD